MDTSSSPVSPRLLDFDISKSGTERYSATLAATQTAAMGTIAYMAPEFFGRDAQRQHSSKGDIFSLGLLFFDCLFPENGKSRVSDLTSVGKVPSIPSSADSFLTDLLSKMLSPDPSHRVRASDVVQHTYFSDIVAPKIGDSILPPSSWAFGSIMDVRYL